MGISCKKQNKPNQTKNLFGASHNISFSPKIKLFHPFRGLRHGQSLFLPPVPPCRHSVQISLDILRVHFAHGTLHPMGWKTGATRPGNSQELS